MPPKSQLRRRGGSAPKPARFLEGLQSIAPGDRGPLLAGRAGADTAAGVSLDEDRNEVVQPGMAQRVLSLSHAGLHRLGIDDAGVLIQHSLLDADQLPAYIRPLKWRLPARLAWSRLGVHDTLRAHLRAQVGQSRMPPTSRESAAPTRI
jgi:hypothetical protein